MVLKRELCTARSKNTHTGTIGGRTYVAGLVPYDREEVDVKVDVEGVWYNIYCDQNNQGKLVGVYFCSLLTEDQVDDADLHTAKHLRAFTQK